ncbi:hypothetical protein PVAP13_8NG070501 [Panicum virgatum]|uniref:Uncharacterized protein n=1 Tax=Panicum virgatum TaxID=38727 RepID=A0A8T0P6E5_PANVG|nr:hypothetical protein PVAP13_8NG070501 [Panicum virgatum]
MDGEQRLGGRRPGVRRGRKTDAARRIRRTGKNGDYNRFDPAAHMTSAKLKIGSVSVTLQLQTRNVL